MNGLFNPPSVIMDMKDIDSNYLGIGTDPSLFMKVKGDGFPFVILWVKTQEDCLFACIEYLAGMPEFIGNADELSHKKGILCIAPDEEHKFTQRIDIEVIR